MATQDNKLAGEEVQIGGKKILAKEA